MPKTGGSIKRYGEPTGKKLERLSSNKPDELTTVDYGYPTALGLKNPGPQALPKLKPKKGMFK